MKLTVLAKIGVRVARKCILNEAPTGRDMSVEQVVKLAHEMRGTGFSWDLLTALDDAGALHRGLNRPGEKT